MREFRKKQKLFNKIFKLLVIATVVFLVVFIGIEPILSKNIVVVFNYISDAMIVLCLVLLFIYSSKFGKSDKFLESIENELSDTGYYFYARIDNSIDGYKNSVRDSLIANGFSYEENLEIDELEFTFRAMKKNEFIYAVTDETIDKNDLIAYIQSAIYDVTSVNIKRKGNGVMLYICDKATDDAIALSKMITPLGKKEQLKFANAIIELSTGRCYFLGNVSTKCQQMIANFAMGCRIPLEEQYIGKERLAFQDELEEHMKSFNIKDFKNNKFYAH